MSEKKNIIFYLIFEFLTNFCLIEQFFSSYLTSAGYNITYVSGFLLIYQITKFGFEIPTGFVSDKYGRKVSAYMGMISLIISYTFLYSHSKLIIGLSFFCRGLAITFISGSIESIVVETIPRQKWSNLSIKRRIIFNLATASAAVLAGVMIEEVGYGATIAIDIIASVMAFITILFVEESATQAKSKEETITIHESILILKNNKILILLFVMDFFIAFSYIGVENLYPAFLEQLGIHSDQIGVFISIQLILASFFGLFAKKVQIILGRTRVMYVLPLVRVLLTVCIYAFNLPIITIPILLTLSQIVLAIYAPIRYELMQDNISNKYRATFISFQSQFIALGGIFFYLFSAVLGGYFSMRKIILIALIMTMVAIIFTSYSIWKIEIGKKVDRGMFGGSIC